jgi:hypothetical protein
MKGFAARRIVRDHDPHCKGIADVRVAFQTKKETARGELEHIAATCGFTRAQPGEPDLPRDSA